MDFTAKASRENPYKNASFISRLLFLWIIPLFREGKRKGLSLDDLYDPLEDDLAGKMGDDLAAEWHRCIAKNKSPSLLGALFTILGKEYMISTIGLLIGELVFRISQPTILRLLIQSFSEHEQANNRDQYLFAIGLSVCNIGVMFYHISAFSMYRLSMRCRLGLSSLIYRKTLRLSACSAYHKTNMGTIVNLLSNDVNRFDQNLIWVIFIPIGTIQLVVFSYLLWIEFGLSALTGVGCLVILLPLQYFNGKLSAKYRLEIATRTDERGRVMNEIITGIRILKMYAWEKPFSSIIHKLRKFEVVAFKKRLYVRGLYFCLYSAVPKFLVFITLLTYILEGNEITADKVFFASAVHFTLCLLWVANIPMAMSGIGEIHVCMKRILDFLQLEEKATSTNFVTHSSYSSESSIPQIILQSVSAQWTADSKSLSLSEITGSLTGDQVVVIVGPCGSGKSSLLHVLLGELPLRNGKALIQGEISYAAQEPWVFAASVRQNILFGRPFIEEKYQSVVEAACLLDDFSQLSHGDHTIVGERGLSLSGGQKARVALARCLYQDASIYLLDDPLSAVDSKVSRHLFDKCIREKLQGKLRILVTHQLQYLPQADHVIVLKEGKILAQGTYRELQDAEIDFVSLLVKEDELDSRKSSLIATKSSSVETQDDMPGNKIDTEGKDEKLKDETKSSGSVGLKLYLDYFKMGKSTILLFLTVIIFLVCQLSLIAMDYFLSFWTNAEVDYSETSGESSSYLGRNVYMYIYAGIAAVVVSTCLLRSFVFLNYTARISINVHNAMFSSLVRAKIRFFDENPSGRVMNRFTKDLGSMDELLPPTMLEMLIIAGQIVGVVVIIVMSNYYMAPPAVIVFAMLWFVRGYYVKTTRDVKRIEGITKSPVFTHSAATFTGLTTIRALQAESILIRQFDLIQDVHSSAWFLFFASARAFAIWCEILSTVFLTIVSISFLLMQDAVPIGNVGLAISAAMTLSGELQYGLRQSAEVENLMTSVERSLEYTDIPSEAALESRPDKKPENEWPRKGSIQFKNVSLSYHDDERENNGKLVLNNLTFDIGSREKIGIVGRTGAGKSSIIQALFRMTEPRPEGHILIDGVVTRDIGLHDLRKAISIIPQDPVLFSGTMRYNLDPFDQFQDNDLWKVIEEVELKDAVSSLDYKISDGGSNFSVGQRQLVCLARAMLRKNKLLVMDEATANVDPETDMLIQKSIRKRFDSECTIITVAHRLHSVIDCDKILVLDKGRLKEYDHPHVLLENGGGSFTRMVEHTGKTSAIYLKNAAREAYIQKTGTR